MSLILCCARFLCIVCEFSLPAAVLFAFVYALLNPCKLPLTFGRVFLRQEECTFRVSVSYLSKAVLIAGAEALTYLNCFISSAFYFLCTMFIGIGTLLLFCWTNLRSADAHLNQMRVYRQLSIWERILNANVRGRLFCSASFGAPVVQVLGTTVLISQRFDLPIMHLMLISMFAVDAFIFVVVVISPGSRIYLETKNWLQRSKLDCGRKKVLRREWKSMRPLKVEMGSNFADETTVLVIEDFAWRQSLALVLLMKER